MQILDFNIVFFRTFSEKLCYQFPKTKGGGSKAVWNFFENPSVLVPRPVPKNLVSVFILKIHLSFNQGGSVAVFLLADTLVSEWAEYQKGTADCLLPNFFLKRKNRELLTFAGHIHGSLLGGMSF